MLRIEEIVGAMDDEFRYALDALGDERLAELAADRAALRRLRPVGVSHAEALAMIAAIQDRRREQRRRDAEAQEKRLLRAQKRKAAPRRKKPAPMNEARGNPPPPQAAAPLPAPPQARLLTAPRAEGPAIRLPPPPEALPAIALPPPVIATPEPAPLAAPAEVIPGGPIRQKDRPRLFLPALFLLLLTILALLVG